MVDDFQSCRRKNKESVREKKDRRGHGVLVAAVGYFPIIIGIFVIFLSLILTAAPSVAFVPVLKRGRVLKATKAAETTVTRNNYGNGKRKKKAPSPDEARAPLTPQLQKYQKLAADPASQFEPDRYNPVPFLTNCHLQTIAGVFLRMEPDCAYATDLSKILPAVSKVRSLNARTNGKNPEEDCDFWDHRERISTPDNDYFHVDYKYVDGSRGTVILLHGLQSSSNSSLSVDMATSYAQRGFDVACINFRGCSGSPEWSNGGYHLGFTDDLRLFLEVLTARRLTKEEKKENDGSAQPKPLYLSGFSLGANVVLKFLGELGEIAVDRYNIAGAAVTGAPFNNVLNNKKIEAPGFNKLVYSNNFLQSMKKRLKEKVEEECTIDDSPDEKSDFDYERCMLASSIAEFETEYIAPVYGYKDNIDYYQKTSCLYFLESIAVPTLIINAADDPFFDPDCFPVEKGFECGGPAPIKFVRTAHGGHLGYMFHQPLVDSKSLLPQRITQKKGDGDDDTIERRPSWMPSEMARFVDHVHVHPTKVAGC